MTGEYKNSWVESPDSNSNFNKFFAPATHNSFNTDKCVSNLAQIQRMAWQTNQLFDRRIAHEMVHHISKLRHSRDHKNLDRSRVSRFSLNHSRLYRVCRRIRRCQFWSDRPPIPHVESGLLSCPEGPLHRFRRPAITPTQNRFFQSQRSSYWPGKTRLNPLANSSHAPL